MYCNLCINYTILLYLIVFFVSNCISEGRKLFNQMLYVYPLPIHHSLAKLKIGGANNLPGKKPIWKSIKVEFKTFNTTPLKIAYLVPTSRCILLSSTGSVLLRFYNGRIIVEMVLVVDKSHGFNCGLLSWLYRWLFVMVLAVTYCHDFSCGLFVMGSVVACCRGFKRGLLS